MMRPHDKDTQVFGRVHEFRTTSWSLVRSSGDAERLGRLIGIYWKPLYFFVRRQGYVNEEAKDIVQGFLATLLGRDAFTKADPARGRFRTFLLAALGNYIKDHIKEAQRSKRGGNQTVFSLDFESGERDYLQVPSRGEPPEAVLDRAWARSLLDQALGELTCVPRHREAFRLYVEGADYREICGRTGLSIAAAKTAVHRLKGQLREIVTEHLRATASSDEEAVDDLSDFLALIS